MDQLPISIISNDLKYALSSLKIKTLQKAREYYHKEQQVIDNQNQNSQLNQSGGISDKLEKIKKYLFRYDTVKQEIWRKINFIQIDQEDQHQNNQTQSNQTKKSLINQNQQEKMQKMQITQNQFYQSRESYDEVDFEDQSRRDKIQKQQYIGTQSLTQSINLNSQTEVKNQKPKNLFEKSLTDNSIVQICGAKGVGKTSLLLYFCEKYAETSNKKIYFINCASGITYKRFERLSKKCPNIEYRDSYILENVLAVCKNAVNDPETGCIAVDSLTNLLMEEQKTLIFLIKLFKIFSGLLPRGCKIVLTNYIQQWFEHKQDEFLTNHYSYYSSVTSEFMKYKYFLKKWPKSHTVLLKMTRGGFIEGEYQIKQDGIDQIKINELNQIV